MCGEFPSNRSWPGNACGVSDDGTRELIKQEIAYGSNLLNDIKKSNSTYGRDEDNKELQTDRTQIKNFIQPGKQGARLKSGMTK